MTIDLIGIKLPDEVAEMYRKLSVDQGVRTAEDAAYDEFLDDAVELISASIADGKGSFQINDN